MILRRLAFWLFALAALAGCRTGPQSPLEWRVASLEESVRALREAQPPNQAALEARAAQLEQRLVRLERIADSPTGQRFASSGWSGTQPPQPQQQPSSPRPAAARQAPPKAQARKTRPPVAHDPNEKAQPAAQVQAQYSSWPQPKAAPPTASASAAYASRIAAPQTSTSPAPAPVASTPQQGGTTPAAPPQKFAPAPQAQAPAPAASISDPNAAAASQARPAFAPPAAAVQPQAQDLGPTVRRPVQQPDQTPYMSDEPTRGVRRREPTLAQAETPLPAARPVGPARPASQRFVDAAGDASPPDLTALAGSAAAYEAQRLANGEPSQTVAQTEPAFDPDRPDHPAELVFASLPQAAEPAMAEVVSLPDPPRAMGGGGTLSSVGPPTLRDVVVYKAESSGLVVLVDVGRPLESAQTFAMDSARWTGSGWARTRIDSGWCWT